MKIVSILGCGWLGIRLKKELESNYIIKCSSRTQKDNFYFLDKTYNNKEFFNCDYLIILIPPRDDYLKNLELISKKILLKTKVILISSTSVYGNLKGLIKEEDTNFLNNKILQAENLAITNIKNLIILRLGGLMGDNRIAGRYTQGKVLENRYVNYIHYKDVIRAITKILEQNKNSGVYNLVALLYLSRAQVFHYTSKLYGFKKSFFKNKKAIFRVVSSKKFKKEFNFKFKIDSLQKMFRRDYGI